MKRLAILLRCTNPQPLTVKDIQALLADDEAIVVVNVGDKKSYVWAVTQHQADWKELTVTTAEVSKAVSALRAGLDFDNVKPFDAQASFALYQKILAPVEDMLRGKPRLSLVLTGALTIEWLKKHPRARSQPASYLFQHHRPTTSFCHRLMTHCETASFDRWRGRSTAGPFDQG